MEVNGRVVPRELRSWVGGQLFEHVPSNIIVIDRDFRVVLANRRFEEVFGETDGRRCFEVYKRRDDVCAKCMAARTFEDGEERIHDESGFDRHGRPAHYIVHIAPIYDDAGSISHVIEMSYDVTAARALQSHYNLLFDRVPCYVSVIDRELRVVRANELVREVFGDAVGQHCYRLYKHRDTQCEDCPALKTFADGNSYAAKQTGTDKSGAPTSFVVSTAALGARGTPTEHIIEMAVDVTEQDRLEHEKLENERLAAVGQTVAQLAHGIKNVLTGIQGGMYALKTGMEKQSPARQQKGWAMLERNVGRITDLVKAFLSYSKGHTPHVESCDLSDIARHVIYLYRDGAAQRDVELILDIEPIEADLDAEDMRTCLENLVSNAIDACLVADTEHPAVTLRLRERDGVITIEVSDNGVGMDVEVKRKVFTTFFTTKGLGGTGLGLLVTRKIVQEHGGTIRVTSDPGSGSVFTIQLPRARLPEPTEAPST